MTPAFLSLPWICLTGGTGGIRARVLRRLLRLVAALPLPVAHAVGAVIGWLFAVVPNRRRRVADINLALCYPELDPRTRRRLARDSLVEYGKTLAETGVLWTREPRDLERLVREVSGEELIGEARRDGGGVILAVPHLGAWELVGLYCSMRYPFTALYRPPPIAGLDRDFVTGRSRFGSRLVRADAMGTRALWRALQRAEVVGILPDQVPKSGGVFAPFFGTQASTMALLSRLAMKTRATVVFAYAERLPGAAGYRLQFLPGAREIAGPELETSVRLVNAGIEACVRRLPQQYQWCYKRFRRRPPGEAAFY